MERKGVKSTGLAALAWLGEDRMQRECNGRIGKAGRG